MLVVALMPGTAVAQTPTGFAQLDGPAGCLRQPGVEFFLEEETP
jgi:hypothetical protein